MELSKFESIKEKIKQNELNSAAAKGKIQAIEDNWEKKYGFRTLAEAEAKKAELEKEIKEKTEIRDKKMKELEESFDWDSII